MYKFRYIQFQIREFKVGSISAASLFYTEVMFGLFLRAMYMKSRMRFEIETDFVTSNRKKFSFPVLMPNPMKQSFLISSVPSELCVHILQHSTFH